MKFFFKTLFLLFYSLNIYSYNLLNISLLNKEGSHIFAESIVESSTGDKILLQANLVNKECDLKNYAYKPVNQQTKKITAFSFVVKHKGGEDRWFLYVRKTMKAQLEFYLAKGPLEFVSLRIFNNTLRMKPSSLPHLSVTYRKPPNEFKMVPYEIFKDHFRIQKLPNKAVVTYSDQLSILYAFATALAYLWP